MPIKIEPYDDPDPGKFPHITKRLVIEGLPTAEEFAQAIDDSGVKSISPLNAASNEAHARGVRLPDEQPGVRDFYMALGALIKHAALHKGVTKLPNYLSVVTWWRDCPAGQQPCPPWCPKK